MRIFGSSLKKASPKSTPLEGPKMCGTQLSSPSYKQRIDSLIKIKNKNKNKKREERCCSRRTPISLTLALGHLCQATSPPASSRPTVSFSSSVLFFSHSSLSHGLGHCTALRSVTIKPLQFQIVADQSLRAASVGILVLVSLSFLLRF